MNGPYRTKNAVVLSGGGAYGAYEVGVLKALASGQPPHLEGGPLDADVYAGTSAGAINAAAFVAQLARGPAGAAAYLEDFWVNRVAEGAGRCGNGVYRIRGAPFELFDPDCLAQQPARTVTNLIGDSFFLLQESLRRGAGFLTSRRSWTRAALETIDLSTFVTTTDFRQGLREAIPLQGIRDSGKELRVIATNFETGQVVTFHERDIVDRVGLDAIFASAAIPAFFPPVEVDGQLHIDGGTLLNTPLLREFADSDVIHLVYMDPDIAAIPLDRLQNTIDILDRIIVVSNAYKINEDLLTVLHINETLALLESLHRRRVLLDEEVEAFFKAASRVFERMQSASPPYRKLTVHRYHPRDDLGGALGFMNLGRDHILDLIQRGYHDALRHDCTASGCIIPGHDTNI